MLLALSVGAMAAIGGGAESSSASPRWPFARGSVVALWRHSSGRLGDRETVLQALAATDGDLLAVAARRRLLKKVVAGLSGPFVLAEAVFAYVAWQGLMLVQDEKYAPNYMQWKVFAGFFYYCIWTISVKSCADICLSACAELLPLLEKVSRRSLTSSAVTCFLGYVPGMWCSSLYLAWDALPDERKSSEFKRSVSLAGYLQLIVLVIAWAVLAVRVRDRAAVSAIRLRVQESLSVARGLLNGCEDIVHHMRKVPFDASELTDPGDGEIKECPICACEFGADLPIVGTACNHVFHEECLAIWCKTHHKCPLCRFDLRDAQVANV